MCLVACPQVNGNISSHEERIFIPISLFVRCFITDVNLENRIEILDIFVSPTVHQLRSSVDLVVLSAVRYGGKLAAVFRCSSSCIHAFGMICLPWIMSICGPS